MKQNIFLLFVLSIIAPISYSHAADTVNVTPDDVVHRALHYLIEHKKDIDANNLELLSISYTFKPKAPFSLSEKDQPIGKIPHADDSLVVTFLLTDSRKEVTSVSGKGTVIQTEGVTVRLPTPLHPDWDIGHMVTQSPMNQKTAEQDAAANP